MKNLYLALLFAVVAVNSACSQKNIIDEIPNEVDSTFKSMFPDASKIKWEMENSKEFEAEFIIKGVKQSANFNNDGVWLETEIEISAGELPKSIIANLDKDFKDYKIEEANKISNLEYGDCFEVEIEKDELTIEVIFSSNGELITKQTLEVQD